MTLATAFVVALVLGTGVLLVVAGGRRFHGLVAGEVQTLLADAAVAVGPDELSARSDALPEPIRRYLRFAISESAPAIRTVHLRHDGLFRTKPHQRWLPIVGQQYFTAATPGFVWNATVRVAPLLWIEARDSLRSGRGSMLVKVLSTFTIADARSPEIDQGASLRWLAECAWLPYAFVGECVEWQAIDAHLARATLRHDGLPVSAIVEIDDEGRLVGLHAERYADIGAGRTVLRPWAGRYADYREFNGFRVPTSVEVAWQLAGERFSYARFRIISLEYNATIGSE